MGQQRREENFSPRKLVVQMLAVSLMAEVSTNALVPRIPMETVIGQPVNLNSSEAIHQPEQEATAVSNVMPPTGTWPAVTGSWATTGGGGWPATATGAWPAASTGGAAGGWPGATGGTGGAGAWTGGAGGAGGVGGWQGGAGGGRWQIPEWVATIPPARIAHASLGATAVLFVFPFGGMIHRVWYHYHNVWVHAAVQMMGYLLFLAAASIGLYMGAVQKKLGGFHPIMGMLLLALLTLQPFTELINYFLFKRWPKIRYVGYVHIWTGRTILLGGIIHGGLGFAYSAKLDRELPMRKGPWPRVVPILYAVVACLVTIAYAATITWTQIKNVRRMSDTSHLDAGGLVENGVAIRLEEHTFSQVRASIKGASERTAGEMAAGGGGDGSEPPQSPQDVVASPQEDTPSTVPVLGPPAAASGSAPAISRISSIKRVFRSDAL